MTRREIIASLAKSVVEAADFGKVGDKDFFGEPITDQTVEYAVKSACDKVCQVIAEDPVQQAEKWAKAEANG